MAKWGAPATAGWSTSKEIYLGEVGSDRWLEWPLGQHFVIANPSLSKYLIACAPGPKIVRLQSPRCSGHSNPCSPYRATDLHAAAIAGVLSGTGITIAASRRGR